MQWAVVMADKRVAMKVALMVVPLAVVMVDVKVDW